MKNTKTIVMLAGLLTISTSLFAASHAGAPMAKDAAIKEMPMPSAADMTDAEVRKVDKENKKNHAQAWCD